MKIFFSQTQETRSVARSCAAFTLFELLAVLTIIGIGLTILVGSYGSWGTAHALTGATGTVEAGLQQARTLAIAQNTYVAFSYGSQATSIPHVVTGFQSFFCQLTNDSTSVETILNTVLKPDSQLEDIAKNDLSISEATSFQRLSGHVKLAYIPESTLASGNSSSSSLLSQSYPDMRIFFRPDGSVLSDPEDTQAHHIIVYTQQRFHRGKDASDPLLRLLRIDLATGLVTRIGGTP